MLQSPPQADLVATTGATRLAVIAAVNDDAILSQNLARSSILTSGEVPLLTYRGCTSTAEAYNRGLDETEGQADILIFAHQDVYVPDGWLSNFRSLEAELDRTDPDWAVLGLFGVTPENRRVGHVWCTGHRRTLGSAFAAPIPTVAVDELLIILRRSSGLSFDPKLPGFHLYGTDIVQMAIAKGKGAYIVHLPVVHNSRPVRRLGRDYAQALAYMRQKWRSQLPLWTLVVPVTRSFWPLFKIRMRLIKQNIMRPPMPADFPRDPSQLARKAGFE
jgi:hypothetical protein